MNLLELGKKIKQLRLQLGMTQNQLAEKINVSYQQIQKYEKGKSHMTVSRFVKLAETLETSPQKLLSVAVNGFRPDAVGRSSPTPLVVKVSADEKKLIGFYRSLPDKGVKACVIKLMKSIAENK